MFMVGLILDKNKCLDGFHVLVGGASLEVDGKMGCGFLKDELIYGMLCEGGKSERGGWGWSG